MIELFAKLHDARFVRYLLASVGALAVDVGTFMAFLAIGTSAALASALGYSIGIVAHWLLSSRTVFSDEVAERGPERTWQKALFVFSALLGLGVTTAIVGFADASGIDPRLAKGFSIAVSFTLTWLLRRHIVFSRRDDAVGN